MIFIQPNTLFIVIDVESSDGYRYVSECCAAACYYDSQRQRLVIVDVFHELCKVPTIEPYICNYVTGLRQETLLKHGMDFRAMLHQLQNWLAKYAQPRSTLFLARDPRMENRCLHSVLRHWSPVQEVCDALVYPWSTHMRFKQGRKHVIQQEQLQVASPCDAHSPLWTRATTPHCARADVMDQISWLAHPHWGAFSLSSGVNK